MSRGPIIWVSFLRISNLSMTDSTSKLPSHQRRKPPKRLPKKRRKARRVRKKRRRRRRRKRARRGKVTMMRSLLRFCLDRLRLCRSLTSFMITLLTIG